MSTENGTYQPEDDLDDTFEQDLRDMLRDGPSLSDAAATIQSGTSANRSGSSNNGSGGQFTGVDLSSPQKSPMSSPPQPRLIQNPSVGSRLAQPARGAAAVRTAAPSSVPPVAQPVATMPTAQTTSIGKPMTGIGGTAVANTPVPGQTTDQVSTSVIAKAKLDSLKSWSISTYKCTRQLVQEKLGKASRTVDLQLEAQIEVLRDTQRKYGNIMKLARALTNHFYQVVQTQRSLGDAFGELAQKSTELSEEFSYNAETQKSLCTNGETLLGALTFFTSSVSTLCNKTMEDTLLTVKQYESARIEYDAYRADLESLQLAPKDATTQARLHDARVKYEGQKERFDKLRQDVAVKLRFLEENKVKVMHKQLLLFHNAISAYFSGNQQALDATLKQFNIRPKAGNEVKPSFLEQ
ncbi:arfaptin-2-like isoform X2 [Patiria miniata]|uniref:AH domain-containing protein n=1 Tax=Patiria miniata TaxID=46514 RepID=A0A913ZXG5_PATMI|nr:arfaptin-2-like isoform X2 [Patiria miniata]